MSSFVLRVVMEPDCVRVGFSIVEIPYQKALSAMLPLVEARRIELRSILHFR